MIGKASQRSDGALQETVLPNRSIVCPWTYVDAHPANMVCRR